MAVSTSIAQTYYTSPGLMTALGEYAPCFDSLPSDIPSLVRIVQSLMLHIFWADRYGYKLPESRQAEVNLRTVPQKMKRLLELDGSTLTIPRPIDRRLVGNCRDFTVMLCAMLQHQGVAARARCGFGVYFWPNHFEDHWVCEYWNAKQGCWTLVDAQLDDFQQKTLGASFDTFDVPRDQFITGGKAWLMVRNGEADPKQFGIFDMHGVAFIRGDLIRDFLALNKVEILPWDRWDYIEDNDQDAAVKDADLMDQLARLTLGGDAAFPNLRTLYEGNARLRVPATWQP